MSRGVAEGMGDTMNGYKGNQEPDSRRRRFPLAYFMLSLLVLLPINALAASAEGIDARVDACLERFHEKEANAAVLLKVAKGVLVLTDIYKVGYLGGIEYGEGALRVDGKTVDYYNIMSASFGMIIGIQKKDVVIFFMRDDALEKFRTRKGWEVGTDFNLAVYDGAGTTIDSSTIDREMVCYVFGVKGIMLDVSLRGSKINKLDKPSGKPSEVK